MPSSFVSVFLLFALLAAKCALVVAVPMPYDAYNADVEARDSSTINAFNRNCVMADQGDSNSSSQNAEDKNKKTHNGSNSHTAGGRTQNCQFGNGNGSPGGGGDDLLNNLLDLGSLA